MQLRRFGNERDENWGFGGTASDLLSILNIGNENRDDPVDLCFQLSILPFIDPFMAITGDMPLTEFPYEWFETLSPAQYDVCKTLRCEPRPRIGIDWEQLNETPEAIKFQLSNQHWDCIAPQTAFELARFITNQNEAGIIKSIQTGLTFEPNDQRWPRGDSQWHERNLAVDVGEAPCRWAIMIENMVDGQIDPNAFRIIPIAAGSWFTSQLPGVVHPEIQPWDQMLFLWGIDHCIRLRCPPGSLVSLWCYRRADATDDGVRSLFGMLKGYTQIMSSDRTYENFTRAY